MYRIRYNTDMGSGSLITRRRRELGLTQAQLAEIAATSRERISTYEREQVSPQVDTLERLLAAMQSELTAVPVLTFEERRSLMISAAVAVKLREDPVPVMAKARQNIEKMRSIGPGEQHWVNVWESVLALGVGHIEALLTSTDQFARDLRQSSPFAGVLSVDERRGVLDGFQR
jgi:transcriptional regulator with XRE-family HTH domain